MSERTVLVDEEMAVFEMQFETVPGKDTVTIDELPSFCAIPDPHLYDLYGGDRERYYVPAVDVPDGTVRGGDRLHVMVELVRGGADE